MQDKGLYWKLGLIILLILGAAYAIWPLNEQLKGGIDLVGGHSLLYEIDTTGLEASRIDGLATRVMERLKMRVDPEQVRNLVWRPVGDTRLEIQMPLAPKETKERREAFRSKVDALRATNVRVSELERAMAREGEARQASLDNLVRGVPAREEILPEVVKAYDAWQQARAQNQDEVTVDELEQLYEEQVERVRETNIDIERFGAILEMAADRQARIDELKEQYPERAALIDEAVAAYASWSEVKASLEDPEDLQRLLRGQGVLEFHVLATPSASNPDQFADYIKRLEEDGPRVRQGDEYAWYEIMKPEEFQGGTIGEYGGKKYVLAYRTGSGKVLDRSRGNWKLADARTTRDDQGMPAVAFEFNEVGASLFLDLTRQNIGNALLIVLDEKAISAPVIRTQISNRGIIQGQFSQEEIEYMVNTLNAGSLEARLRDNPISVHSIGSSLGDDNRKAGLQAALLGLIAVLAFMAIYYMWAGMIADVALILNLLFLLAAMASLEATFTMAGIAGVVLTLGMAVDANVLIYERFREESAKVQSIRLIIKNGYDRALPPILDANITTLITSVVLYYIGTEEIKGFALTLGLGLVISLFTSLVVTRVIFDLLAQKGLIKSMPMLQFFRRPRINWMGKQKYFWAASGTLIVLGLVLFPLRGPEKYDIEFRGGTAVQVVLKEPGSLGFEQVRGEVKEAGRELAASAEAIAGAELVSDPQQPNRYRLSLQGVSTERAEAALLSFMDAQIEKGSLRTVANETVAFAIRGELGKEMGPEQVAKYIKETVAAETRRTGQQLADAQVQSVGEAGDRFEIVTVATAQQLVIDAIVDVMGEQLEIQPSLAFDPNIKYYPVTARRLSEVVGTNDPAYVRDVSDYRDGVTFVVQGIDPAVTTEDISSRLVAMRQQPDFEKMQWRDFRVIGLEPAPGQDVANLPENEIRYQSVAVAVSDPAYPYDQDEDLWMQELVTSELTLVTEAMSQTSALEKVTQFGAQVAAQAKTSAVLALIVSFAAIIMYLWVRFGTPRHGLAAVIALAHDVLICLAFVMIAHYAADAFGAPGMLEFKINLALVAAFLTVIGYSVNDTIVVFDRIRETRGKLKEINAGIINDSINQTLSRTVLTGVTTLLVMVIMYVFGGEGVRGFSYVMVIGTIVGTYSSIAIASPLLLGWFGRIGAAENDTATAAPEAAYARKE